MIRRMIQSALCICLSPLVVAQQVASPISTPVVLKKGTEVKLVLFETISSATAKNGQKVRMAVAEDVTLNGAIVIPRGSLATGEVTEIRKAKPQKRNGFFVIKPIDFMLADGTRLKLREYRPGEDSCEDFGACWAMWTFFGPLMLLVLTKTAIENRDYREAGKDYVRERCSPGYGFLARDLMILSSDHDSVRKPKPHVSQPAAQPDAQAVLCSSQQDRPPEAH